MSDSDETTLTSWTEINSRFVSHSVPQSDDEDDTDQIPTILLGKGNAYQYQKDLKFNIWNELGSAAWNLKVLGSLVKMGLGPELDDSLKRLLWAEHPHKEVKGKMLACEGNHKTKILQLIALIIFNSGTFSKANYRGGFVLCNTTLVVVRDMDSVQEWMTQLAEKAPDLFVLRLPNADRQARHRVDLFHVVVTTYRNMDDACRNNSQLWHCKFRRVIIDNFSGDRRFKKFADLHFIHSERQWYVGGD